MPYISQFQEQLNERYHNQGLFKSFMKNHLNSQKPKNLNAITKFIDETFTNANLNVYSIGIKDILLTPNSISISLIDNGIPSKYSSIITQNLAQNHILHEWVNDNQISLYLD